MMGKSVSGRSPSDVSIEDAFESRWGKDSTVLDRGVSRNKNVLKCKRDGLRIRFGSST